MTISDSSSTTGCPVHDHIDRRKTAKLAAEKNQVAAGAHWVKEPDIARKILRSKEARQAGAGAEHLHYKKPEQAPVFFLDGEDHAHKRRESLRFLSPKAVAQQHFSVMQEVSKKLIEEFRRAGRVQFDDVSFKLAVEVVGVILGLTESDLQGRARRILRVLHASLTQPKNNALSRFWVTMRRIVHTGVFYIFDVRPAINARKKSPKDDAISTYLDDGYSHASIVIECLTYGTAGMMTTREFIIMCAWYMLEDETLKERYLAADMKGQLAILLEILRLEPVATKILRRINDESPEGIEEPLLRPGEKYDINIRELNTNEELVGECPFAIDPERAKRQQDSGRFFSFGDGPHGCPGWQVALHETRIFLDQLLRVPGVKLEKAPDITWNYVAHGYELRNAVVSCDAIR